jgi:hypothetical protein
VSFYSDTDQVRNQRLDVIGAAPPPPYVSLSSVWIALEGTTRCGHGPYASGRCKAPYDAKLSIAYALTAMTVMSMRISLRLASSDTLAKRRVFLTPNIC